MAAFQLPSQKSVFEKLSPVGWLADRHGKPSNLPPVFGTRITSVFISQFARQFTLNLSAQSAQSTNRRHAQ